VFTVVALVFITAITTKAARRRRTTLDPVRNRPPPPPVVNCVSFIGLLHTLYTKGLQAMIYERYKKLGSVFTVSFIWWKVTFLVGPEVSRHFYQGLDSEVSVHMVGFSVPMIGKEVGYGVDAATQNEQTRFFSDALRPSKLRSHVGPMLQEVEVSYRIIMCPSFCSFYLTSFGQK
jgi:sterol 14alpha-demethylase